MNKALLPLLFSIMLGLSAAAQQTPAPNGKTVVSDQMINTLVNFDVKRFNLTPEQTVQDKKVITDYQTRSNAISQNSSLTVDELKASIKKARLALAKGYKTFLNPEQYSHFLTTYNKLHPNEQLN